MNRGFSVYLDALRVLAAFVVLVSHWAYPRFTDGVYIFVRELNLGSDAVVIFFVLSGLVIAFAADVKDRTAKRYLFSRATRIYSVAIPAVILTFFVDRIGAAIEWPAYDGWWYNGASLQSTLWYALTFSNEWWDDFRVGTNGPYWSLSYEVAYYLLYAAAIYAVGWVRAALLLLIVVAVGPFVLLLMPCWLLGVAVWKQIKAGRYWPRRTALAAAIGGPLLYAGALAIDMPGVLLDLTERALGVNRAFNVLRFSDEFLWNWIIAALTAAHVLGMASLFAAREATTKPGSGLASAAAAPSRMAWAVRWAAGASFSLYVVHYPVMCLVEVLTPETMWAPMRHYLILSVTIAVCLLFAQAFERPLPAFRAAVLRLAAWPRRSAPCNPGRHRV